jgi:hypothetical protein
MSNVDAFLQDNQEYLEK